MGKMSRQKGKRGELELCKLFQSHGVEARRSQQFCGKAGDADLQVDLDGVHIECKRVEALSLYKAMGQAVSDAKEGDMPVVFHRRNGEKWLMVVEGDLGVEMLKLAATFGLGKADM